MEFGKTNNTLFFDGREIALTDSSTAAGVRVPPSSFLLLGYGKTAYTKGEERGEYELTAGDADKVLADFSTRGKDVVVDYEHQTLSGQEAPAAGWIDRLEKTAEGIVAHVRNWTEKASNYLGQGEYRYFSPVLYTSRRHPFALHSVALTNHPATHGIPALVASDAPGDDDPNPKQQENQAMLKTIAEKLGITLALSDGQPDEKTTLTLVMNKLSEMLCELDKLRAFLQLHDGKTLDDVTGRIKGMVPASELTALNDRLAGIEADKAVAKAFADRKLVEAQRPWAAEYAKKDLKAFSDFVAAQPVVAPAPAAGVQTQTGTAVVDLTDGEKQTAKLLGLTDDEMKAQKTPKK